jgi:hypothetical protein
MGVTYYAKLNNGTVLPFSFEIDSIEKAIKLIDETIKLGADIKAVFIK